MKDVWRWRETGGQEAWGQIVRALESYVEKNKSGQPSGTPSWRESFLSCREAISPRRETRSKPSHMEEAPGAVHYSKEPPDGSVTRPPALSLTIADVFPVLR